MDQQPGSDFVYFLQPAGPDQPPGTAVVIPLTAAAEMMQGSAEVGQQTEVAGFGSAPFAPLMSPSTDAAAQGGVNPAACYERMLIERFNSGNPVGQTFSGPVAPQAPPEDPPEVEQPSSPSKTSGAANSPAKPSSPKERRVVIPDYFQDGSRPLEVSKKVGKPLKSKKSHKKSKKKQT